MISTAQRAVLRLERASSSGQLNASLQQWLKGLGWTPQGWPSCSVVFGRALQTAAQPATEPQLGLLLSEYRKLVDTGVLKLDSNQEQCALHLSQLYDQLPAYRAAVDEFEVRHKAYQELRQRKRQELLAGEAAEAELRRRRAPAESVPSSSLACHKGLNTGCYKPSYKLLKPLFIGTTRLCSVHAYQMGTGNRGESWWGRLRQKLGQQRGRTGFHNYFGVLSLFDY